MASGQDIRSDSGALPIAVGLLLFGVVLGATTGLSHVSGISQTLLTSLFTFVGGVLLTWAGFRRKQPTTGDGAVVELDPRIVGIGLSCFSVGVLLGLTLGVTTRMRIETPCAWRRVWSSETSCASVKANGEPNGEEKILLLHDFSVSECGAISSNLSSGYYANSDEGKKQAIETLRRLIGDVCKDH